MEKPTVFLSHSSLDKAPLAALKKLLDDRAAGSLNFFLSSDGESIRFGRNWVVRISDALSAAKLMFVFLSPQSADSKWIHFEAGCAYAKGVQVVPVCLPGIDLNRITPPLNLLQGFNLHSHEAMGNLARICNETFDMRINESFNREDFVNSVSGTMAGAGFFGDQSWAIEVIRLNSQTTVPTDDFNPLPALHEMCKKARMNCHYVTKGILPATIEASVEQPGCTIEFKNFAINESVAMRDKATVRRQYRIDCTLSPELFHLNSPLIDQWLNEIHLTTPLRASFTFKKGVVREKQRERFTSKMYQCGIHLAENGEFEFEGLRFKLDDWLHFLLTSNLEDNRLPQLLGRLFKSSVLWEQQPDFSEMFG
jgi:TIR domain